MRSAQPTEIRAVLVDKETFEDIVSQMRGDHGERFELDWCEIDARGFYTPTISLLPPPPRAPWLMRLRRWLDLEAPADGLCGWTRETITTTTGYSGAHEYRMVYRCREPWHHRGGHHSERGEELRS
jgi:hypothetical protein